MKRDPITEELNKRKKETLSPANRRQILHELKQEEEKIEHDHKKTKRSWLPPGKGMTYAATLLLFPVIAYVMWALLEGTSDRDETIFFQSEQVNITAPDDPDTSARMFHFESENAGTYVLEGSPDELVTELISEDKDVDTIERFGMIEGSQYQFFGYYYVDDHRRLNLAGAVTLDAGAEEERYLAEVFSIQIDETTLRTGHESGTEMMTVLREGLPNNHYLFGLGFSNEANVESLEVEDFPKVETLVAENQLMMFGYGETLEHYVNELVEELELHTNLDRLETKVCLDDGTCYEQEFLRHPLLPERIN
ncbi:hypothetical protein [Salisediminibacterium beveridgei]|uniref:Uncharacterized protein n=1 Tax=Salisediminibacterium beveridgei TaxID=632773 RepID=A0A1D7QZ93_9BACI|nr:hypothetical protein [Salisediminibacterium beveridgei]AOM84339.1 hypothetical protein BBEV_3021 [Salisediminibacterium beveridgei]